MLFVELDASGGCMGLFRTHVIQCTITAKCCKLLKVQIYWKKKEFPKFTACFQSNKIFCFNPCLRWRLIRRFQSIKQQRFLSTARFSFDMNIPDLFFPINTDDCVSSERVAERDRVPVAELRAGLAIGAEGKPWSCLVAVNVQCRLQFAHE